jgi:bacterioferritin-associated ferredoxin
MYICICKAVTDQQLKQALAEGCASKRALCAKFGVGSQCGRCAPTLREFLDEHVALPEIGIQENQTSAA